MLESWRGMWCLTLNSSPCVPGFNGESRTDIIIPTAKQCSDMARKVKIRPISHWVSPHFLHIYLYWMNIIHTCLICLQRSQDSVNGLLVTRQCNDINIITAGTDSAIRFATIHDMFAYEMSTWNLWSFRFYRLWDIRDPANSKILSDRPQQSGGVVYDVRRVEGTDIIQVRLIIFYRIPSLIGRKLKRKRASSPRSPDSAQHHVQINRRPTIVNDGDVANGH